MKTTTTPTWWGDSVPVYPALAGDLETEVVIVGGGLAGVLSAYLLAKAGHKVVLLESESLAAGATGRTTAFVTEVIDTSATKLIKMFGREKAKTIWQAGRTAIEEIAQIIAAEKIECEFIRCPAYIYASSDRELKTLRRQEQALRELGAQVEFKNDRAVEFENKGYLEIGSQATFNPLQFIYGVAAAAKQNGALIFEHSKVLTLTGGEKITARTADASVHAKFSIVATYKPFQKIKKLAFKTAMYTTYVLEIKLPKGQFKSAYISQDLANPYHYFRVDLGEESDRLIVGGEDHRSDIPVSTVKSFAALTGYARSLLGSFEHTLVRKWRGPILESLDGTPFIGEYAPNQYVATAFSGNGMTYSFISAKIFRDLLAGNPNVWANTFDPRRKLKLRTLYVKSFDYLGELLGGAIKNIFGL